MPTGNTALISGILGGFSDVGLKQQKQKHDDELEQKRNRISILTSIDPSTLDETGRQHLGEMLDEVMGGGKGGKGGKKGGQAGPFTSLFDKIAPLFGKHPGAQAGAGGGQMQAPPRPDGLANVVPQAAQGGGVFPSGQAKMTPGAADTPGASPAQQPPMSEHLGLPAGQSLETVPQPGANVPRGTIHPADSPATLGSLWANQDPQLAAQRAQDQRQKLADDFRKKWEAKNGPLSKEQEDMLMEHVNQMPAGFARAGRQDKAIAHGVLSPYDGTKSTLMEGPNGERYYIPEYEKPVAPPKPTAIQQKDQQDRDDYKAANPGVTDAEAEHAVRIGRYKDTLQKRLTASFRGELTEDQAQAAAKRLADGTPTVKDARFVLRDAEMAARQRFTRALQEAKNFFPSTGGQPGPDNGKTLQQLIDDEMESQGFNADEIHKLAAGSAPRRSATPSGGGGGGNPKDPDGILK